MHKPQDMGLRATVRLINGQQILPYSNKDEGEKIEVRETPTRQQQGRENKREACGREKVTRNWEGSAPLPVALLCA